MEKERVINCQKKFSSLHLLLVLFVMVLIIEHGIYETEENMVGPLIACIAFAIFESILRIRSFFNSLRLIRMLRYLEVLGVSILLIFPNNANIEVCSYLIYFLLLYEFMISVDVTDKYDRYSSLIVALLPSIALQFLRLSRGQKEYFRFGYLICVAVVFSIMYGIIQCYTDMKNHLEEKYLTQLRYIEDANAVNLQLVENQEKVKRANEQLAYQKLQLEVANKRINNVNSEILLQNQILKLISAQHDVVRIMSLIVATIRTQMNVDTLAIILYPNAVSSKKLTYQMRTSYGFKYQQFLGEKIEEGCFDPYIMQNQTYVDNNVEENKYEFVKNKEVASLMIIPLIKADKIIGGLYIADSKYDVFTDNVPFFESAVSSIIIAVENSNLYAKLEEMAIKDELTGIYNRRYLNKICEQFIFEALRNKTPLSVALFDIDRFKKFNDSYGHLFGDEALKFIANMASEIANEVNGIAGRYGGEEFVVIFPNRNLEDTYDIVKRFHDSIKTASFYHENEPVQIRLSVGISSFPETCLNPNDLLNHADWAMYYSKENGRDRITIDSAFIRTQVRLK